jgi:3-phosphoglycerate kinase
MKICFLGIPGINVGKHNVKDPRLDQADKLVEAKKKACVQVDVLPESDQADADALICSADTKPDLILNDLEFVETRLGRGAS